MQKPKATEIRRLKPKSFFNGAANQRQKGHSEEYTYVRSAHCGDETHPPSSNFVGINEHGWIFRCKGVLGESVMLDGFGPSLSNFEHVFIAEPE